MPVVGATLLAACAVSGRSALAQGAPPPASLRLAKIFQDGAVLQRGVALPIRGEAPRGEQRDGHARRTQRARRRCS